MDIQLIGIMAVGGVFAVGLLVLGIYGLCSDFVSGKIPKPPKHLKKHRIL